MTKGKCAECGSDIILTRSNRRYCYTCIDIRRIEKDRARAKRKREKRKETALGVDAALVSGGTRV
jgi:ssDNA-binding Zn-finger/Zn-ribbon topoisomerase 1